MRHYTSLFHLLRHQHLTLLNPKTWDDRNDSYFVARYAEELGAGSVLALCFAQTFETYHHWRVFPSGADGVCIEFDPARLLSHLPADITARPVAYFTIDKVSEAAQDRTSLPFIKRFPFQDEREFRLLWSTEAKGVTTKPVPISLNAIRRVTISPWMPLPLSDVVRDVIRGIAGCADLRVGRSTLVENERWKSAVPIADRGVR